MQGIRHDGGKLRFDVLPLEGIVELARVGTDPIVNGDYPPHNWRLGMDWSRIFNASMRHALKFWLGETYDDKTGCHHMAHAAWGMLVLVAYTQRRIGNDDRQGAEEAVDVVEEWFSTVTKRGEEDDVWNEIEDTGVDNYRFRFAGDTWVCDGAGSCEDSAGGSDVRDTGSAPSRKSPGRNRRRRSKAKRKK